LEVIMPVKSAAEKLQDTIAFLDTAKASIAQIQGMRRLLETEDEFRKLWEADSAAALRQVGIDPASRQEMSLGSYAEGARCDWCVTPNGNACHC
jgi:hypothetical protein